jgi:hypothetical protein
MTGVFGVGGQVLPGFGRVADAFAQNLGEIGAACSVYVDGALAVHLWGGLADAETDTPWTDQTIVMGVLHEQGPEGNVRALARSARRALV